MLPNHFARCPAHAAAAAWLLAAALLLSSCGSDARPSNAGPPAAVETDQTGTRPAAVETDQTGAQPAAPGGGAPPSNPAAPALSLDAVFRLSRQGDALTLSDFDAYAYREIGSGLYIRQYEIDEQFELFIGGYQPDGNPLYIYLKIRGSEADRIDIRTGDVTAFIERHRGSAAASARNG